MLRRQALKMPRTNRAVTFAGLIPLISPTHRLAHQFLRKAARELAPCLFEKPVGSWRFPPVSADSCVVLGIDS